MTEKDVRAARKKIGGAPPPSGEDALGLSPPRHVRRKTQSDRRAEDPLSQQKAREGTATSVAAENLWSVALKRRRSGQNALHRWHLAVVGRGENPSHHAVAIEDEERWDRIVRLAIAMMLYQPERSQQRFLLVAQQRDVGAQESREHLRAINRVGANCDGLQSLA